MWKLNDRAPLCEIVKSQDFVWTFWISQGSNSLFEENTQNKNSTSEFILMKQALLTQIQWNQEIFLQINVLWWNDPFIPVF